MFNVEHDTFMTLGQKKFVGTYFVKKESLMKRAGAFFFTK